MAQRGRASASALSLVTTSPIEAIPRLPVPENLTPAEAEEWVQIVNTMPAEHFSRVNQGLLEQYCCHMVTSRMIGRRLSQLSYDDPRERDEMMDLLSRRQSESYVLISLMRQMRLTQQSIFRSETIKHPTRATKKPWEKK